MIGVVLSDDPLPDQGWFVAFDDQQHGPMTTSEAWHCVLRAPPETSIHVWHRSLPDWQTLSTGQSNTSGPASWPLRLNDLRLSNSKYIIWITCFMAPAFLIGSALAREFQDPSFSALVVGIVGFLGWWLYLEQYGLRMLNADLAFPFRLPFWPYPALWLRRLRMSDISSFECWARSSSVQHFRIHVPGRSHLIVLDNLFYREILTAALEEQLPQS